MSPGQPPDCRPPASGETAASAVLVNVADRFSSLLYDPVFSYEDEVTYSYCAGGETLTIKREGGGSSEYRGTFHPNDGMCEGGGVCKWCGCILGEFAA